MAGNAALNAAGTAKKDEFYTQRSDIENELQHYEEHFMGKTVLCNCDDPFESEFFQYFALNFVHLGLKKLIATSYNPSPIAGTQFNYRVDRDGQLSVFYGEEAMRVGEDDGPKPPYKAVVTAVHDATGNGGVAMVDVAELFKMGENTLTQLAGDGDFRSPECLALLDEADIVVTNPPFSLFREYVATLVEHDKKFLIIGNQNAITYKEIFPLLKENKIWLGYKFGDMAFKVPASYEPRETRYWQDKTGQKWRSLGTICWFTNLDMRKRHEELVFIRHYSPEKYPKYDNYNAINVDKVVDIPGDYAGNMGVPITFMDKYNPDQFEIIGATESEGKGFSNGLWNKESGIAQPLVSGKKLYKRIFIRNKNPERPKEARIWK